MDILLITGPPYSGKGTQCGILKEKLGYRHISTGDIIREEKAKQTPIGKTMQQYEEKGELVPDAVMEDLLNQILRECMHEKGIILDGYPRTIPQVDTLMRVLQRNGLRISLAININVPPEELLQRAGTRAETSNRKDDQNTDTHLKRIRIFEEETRPAIAYLGKLMPLEQIDGLGTIPEITGKLLKIIEGI